MSTSKTIIIAEAGVNHNGDIQLAFELIHQAALAGADYVKFQTFITEEVISLDAPKAGYQQVQTGNAETQFEMVKKLELSKEAHILLQKKCKEEGIGFLSTPFDLPSIDLLEELQLEHIKIPSGEINNVPYLRHIANKFQKYYLSTGMSDIEEISFAVDLLMQGGVTLDQLTILHCNTEYPTELADVNLRAMQTIQQHFKTAVGYSDHTIGWEVAVAAVALGASVVEKHFTLDKNMAGPDHKASLEPEELQLLVKKIRGIEIALGSSNKLIADSAQRNALVAKKSIVARVAIEKGAIFTAQNITVRRPGTGISASLWDEVIGQTASKHFEIGEKIVI